MSALRTIRRPALWLVACAVLAGFAFPGLVRSAGLIHDGPAPDLMLLYTGDVIGFVDPCG